jgi:hypothetical protein
MNSSENEFKNLKKDEDIRKIYNYEHKKIVY